MAVILFLCPLRSAHFDFLRIYDDYEISGIHVWSKFSFVFADTWPGKYLLLDEVLEMVEKGGIYIIDDMLPQANWPTGHGEKAAELIADLDSRDDIILTKMGWATGIVIITKR